MNIVCISVPALCPDGPSIGLDLSGDQICCALKSGSLAKVINTLSQVFKGDFCADETYVCHLGYLS